MPHTMPYIAFSELCSMADVCMRRGITVEKKVGFGVRHDFISPVCHLVTL